MTIQIKDLILIPVILVILICSLWIGMGREIERKNAVTQYNCKYYGHAMNNYNRQHNMPVVCEE
jgi:hypothetical protein